MEWQRRGSHVYILLWLEETIRPDYINEICGQTSFKALKTVGGVENPTFQAAGRTLRLLEDDNHWARTLEEASIFDFPYKIREFFAIMIVFCQVGDPIKLWGKYRDSLLGDIRR
ncbi:ATP-dependent DNA helicase [Nephila pilipes]|uniref:ATP-dependent DNA helicase n=1 Tax=Nephila pilipes TaxID=299642 RepID=A0A8X6ITN2_NEPPI|nr:ATP-dependent DNA helicase [Nephila pilipes]